MNRSRLSDLAFWSAGVAVGSAVGTSLVMLLWPADGSQCYPHTLAECHVEAVTNPDHDCPVCDFHAEYYHIEER